MDDKLEILKSKGVKATSNRILVLDALKAQNSPVSLIELEDYLQTVDKSSIFRVLSLFLEKEVVHGIDDGSGSLKYELCHSDHHCSISDMHVHFHCERCRQTFCLKNVAVPEVAVPENFEVRSVNYVIKGICSDCRKILEK